MPTLQDRRILITDDNPSIHDDFRKIFESGDVESSLQAKEAVLFGGPSQATPTSDGFEIVSAYQGEEGLEKLAEARREGRPFSVAFVDVRMPPGMDGVETIERAWNIDPDIQFVICSAYSDYTTRDILVRLGISDRLLLLRKPCDSAEILLMATALCQKWNLAQATHGTIA